METVAVGSALADPGLVITVEQNDIKRRTKEATYGYIYVFTESFTRQG